ncbi:hypothetical protein HYU18_02015, partial [Candidatus Woesearchaeota archaeon]|nr:hypothetical protein [Candidatus Woesearchaeota archaeon]
MRFILDVNDTLTTDNSSASNVWYLKNVSINLTAVDVANGSGANRTLWCTFTAGLQPCTPTIEVFNPSGDFRLPINCSTGDSCQVRVRYYSIDNVSNNESGGANGGTIRESNTVNIATGGSDVQDSFINNSAIQNNSFIRSSNITNSTVNDCRVVGSVVIRSTLQRHPDHRYNCTVSESTVIDVNVTSSIIEKQSYVDPSIIIDSVITNSTIRNSTVSFSRVENSTFCGNFSVYSGVILNNTLIDGRITFNGSNYFGPAALSNICAGVPSSPVGSLVADPSVANNSASIIFRYTATSTGYNLTIGQPELFSLDNTSTKSIALNDNGAFPDLTANDAVYSGNYTISPLNNQSDGNKTIVAQVSDNLGNNWTVRTNVTLDRTAPYVAMVVNGNNINTTSASVSLNLTFSDAIGVRDCRFANEDRVFGSFESCSSVKSWTLSSGNGLKTVVVQVRDTASNVNETNDTITLLGSGTSITSPVSGDVVKGSKNVVVIAPDAATWVTFVVINSTNSTQNWSLSGAVGGITNDTNPGDGFVQAWATTLFGNESLVNLTAIAYGASGSFLSNDTQGNIQVDNAPPNVTLDIPRASTAYNRLVRVNASASNDTSTVRFDYRTSSAADWQTIGTAYTFPYVLDWNTAVLADGASYEVRANATDDAGWTSVSTHTAVELDNTGPSVAITAPVAGASISGTFNITFTILGTVSSRAIQFDGGAWLATTANTSHSWDTTTVADGAHLIRVQANDTLNNTGYSEILIVQVDNGGANVILLSPASGGYKSGNVALEVTAPGTTFNVTFNISNSTGFFNTTGNVSAVTLDNVSSDGWTATWVTSRFVEDGVYNVNVAAFDASNAFLGSDSATSIEVDNLIPNNVTNLTILSHPSDSDGTLVLNWTSSTSTDIDHYNVYRSNTQNFAAGSGFFLKSVGSNTTTDTVPAGTWFYKVTSVDNVGRESNASIEVNSTVQIAGPTGSMDINATYARENSTVKFTYTGSAADLTAVINASEIMKLDSRVVHDFEKLWSTSSNNSLNQTLNGTAKAGSFSLQLRTNESGALNENITVDLSAAGVVNLSSYNRLLLWVRSNITGNVLNFTFGTDNYTQAGNFTVSIDEVNVWEHKEFDISSIPVNGTRGNRSSVRYLMFNVTASAPMRLLLDDLEASNQVTMLDNGLGEDSVSGDAIYTGALNITVDSNVSDGFKTIKAHITDSAGNSLHPQDTITLDNTVPFSVVLINEGDTFTLSRTVTLNLTFNDASSGVNQCRYSNTQPITSSYETCAVLKVWTTTTGGGTKTVFYEVMDNAGNVNISNDTIVLDTTLPEMIITYPAPGAVVNGTVNVTFSGAESTQPQVSIDGANWSNTTAVNFYVWNTTNLSEGTHSIRIRDTDSAGNIGYSEPLLVTVDNIQGLVTFITPQSNQILTGNVIVRVTVTEDVKNVSFVIFNTTSGRSIQVYNDTDPLDGWNFTLNTAAYEDGLWELKANTTNSFNKVIDGAVLNNLRFDNVAPTATLQSPVNGQSVRGTVIINVTASSDVKQVTFEYSNDSGTGWQPLGVDFSPVAGWTIAWDTSFVNDASTYRVRANATDYAGLSVLAQNTADIAIDNTPPRITIIVPVAGSTVSGIVNVSFSGGERHPMVSVDGGAAVNASSIQNYTWNTASISDGTHTVRINDSDALGNIGYSDTVTVFVDNTPDVVSIVSPPRTTASATGNLEVIVIAPSNTRFVLFNVSNSTLNMSVTGVPGITNDTNPADGWRQTITTATFADGFYNISVAAYNELGNLTGRDNLTNVEFDNSAPSAPVLRPLPGFDTDGVVQLEWSNVTAAVADVIYYNVYRSTNISFTLSAATRIKNVSGNFNTTTDFPGVNAKYYYKVTAVDNAFLEGVSSNEENTTVSVTEAGALVGTLSVNDSIVKDGDAMVFKYASSATDLNVTINTSQMQLLDNASRIDLRLVDSGAAPDAVADDAVYTANFTISAGNNQSDGNVQLRAIVNDSANNQFLPTINVTLDNTRPNASIIINGGDGNASSSTVTLRLGFNDTLAGVQSCRLADEDRQFGEWEPCASQRSWTLSSGSGLKTVVLQVRDFADNVNETNDTITYQALAAVTILRPATDAAITNNVLIEAVGPATAAKIEFRIYNGTSYWPASGVSTGSTNDSVPENGFSATWATLSFLDSIYNVTAVAYDVNGNYIANDTNTNIEVDNTAPAAVILTPLQQFYNRNVVSLNWSQSSSLDVVYYNVYRSNNVSFTLSSGALLKNVSGNSTSDVVLDGQWFYKVTAVDNTGKESAASNEVNVTVITGVPPSELYGTLSVNVSAVRNGSSVLFTFAGSATDLNVTINQSEMRKLDNTSGAINLNDSGINGDFQVSDATYSAAFTLSMLNNVSEGMKELTAEVNDSAGNLYRPRVNITLDNTKPNVTVMINGNLSLATSRVVTLAVVANDSVGIGSCRFANEDRVFNDWESCVSTEGWQLSALTGLKVVVVQARDSA